MMNVKDLLNTITHCDCISSMREMPNECIDLVLTDLPYLVNYLPRDGRRCLNDDNVGFFPHSSSYFAS
jgi:DNA modification methylase